MEQGKLPNKDILGWNIHLYNCQIRENIVKKGGLKIDTLLKSKFNKENTAFEELMTVLLDNLRQDYHMNVYRQIES